MNVKQYKFLLSLAEIDENKNLYYKDETGAKVYFALVRSEADFAKNYYKHNITGFSYTNDMGSNDLLDIAYLI